MRCRRDPTQLMQIGFLLLLVISAATVGWWMYDHVRYARASSNASRRCDPAPVRGGQRGRRMPRISIYGHRERSPRALTGSRRAPA